MKTILVIAILLLFALVVMAQHGNGWFLVQSNNVPVWTLNGGAITNIFATIPNPLVGTFIGDGNGLTNLNLINATNESLLLGLNGTNNSVTLSNNLQTAITNEALFIGSGATNEALLIGLNGTNNSVTVSNNLQIAITNEALFIGSGATNEALLMGLGGTNNSVTLSNNLQTAITNEALLIGSGATNEALLIGLNETNNAVTVSNNLQTAITNESVNAATSATNVLGSAAWKSTSFFDLAGSGTTAASNATNVLGSAAWQNTSAFDASGAALNATNGVTLAFILGRFPYYAVTNGEANAITVSNTWTVDPAHFLTGNIAALTITNFASAGSRHQMTDANKKVVDATASGAVPINADGTATTFAQVNALAGGSVVTNGESLLITISNNWVADPTHFITGNVAALTLTNFASAGSRIQITDANRKISDASGSGAVPINADGTATTAAQISALVTINSSGFTNNLVSKSANYNVAATDWMVLLTGNHTATLPTAVGISGKTFLIKCSSSGTNRIATTSSQTIDGAAQWTNTAVNKFTMVISDNANWWVIGQN